MERQTNAHISRTELLSFNQFAMNFLKSWGGFLLLAAFAGHAEATSQPVCEYKTLSGQSEFLQYFPNTDTSREYIDYGSNQDKVCVQRARCTKNYVTVIDRCANIRVKVDCAAVLASAEPSFPSCCIKC